MCGFVFSYSIQGFGRLIHTGGVLLCQGRLIDELGNDMDSTATRLDFIQVDNLPPFFLFKVILQERDQLSYKEY
jgi:hypothetical protein